MGMFYMKGSIINWILILIIVLVVIGILAITISIDNNVLDISINLSGIKDIGIKNLTGVIM